MLVFKMTAIKELYELIEKNINEIPKVSKDSIVFHYIKNRIKELAKKDLEKYQKKIKHNETVLTQNIVSVLGHDMIKDLEEIVGD